MSIDRLRRLIVSAPALGADGAWFAERLQHYLDNARAGETLERTFEVATSFGSRPWWQREEREHRREAARVLANLCPETDRSKAAAIADSLRRYQGGRWRLYRRDDRSDFDPKRGAMHTLLAANNGEVPSPKTIKRLLDEVDTTSPRLCPPTHGLIQVEVPDDECTAD